MLAFDGLAYPWQYLLKSRENEIFITSLLQVMTDGTASSGSIVLDHEGVDEAYIFCLRRNLHGLSKDAQMIWRWKKVMITLAIIVGLMLLFPPYHVVYAPGVVISKGYGFLLNPPRFQDRIVSTVDIRVLFLQAGAVIFLGLLYGFLFTKKE